MGKEKIRRRLAAGHRRGGARVAQVTGLLVNLINEVLPE
jgi:hypothetical protein